MFAFGLDDGGEGVGSTAYTGAGAAYRFPEPRCPDRRTASRNAAASLSIFISPSWSKGGSVAEVVGYFTTGGGEELLTTRFPERKDGQDGALAAVLADEHVLLLGPPGTAKSALVRAIAQAFGGSTPGTLGVR